VHFNGEQVLCMDRRRVPKSKHWSLEVLDVLQDDEWHQYVRAGRSAYEYTCALALLSDQSTDAERRVHASQRDARSERAVTC